MYSMYNQSRPGEDSDEDDRPASPPARSYTKTAAASTASAGQSTTKSSGSGVARAIAAARRQEQYPTNVYGKSGVVEDSYSSVAQMPTVASRATGKSGMRTTGSTQVGAFPVQGRAPNGVVEDSYSSEAQMPTVPSRATGKSGMRTTGSTQVGAFPVQGRAPSSAQPNVSFAENTYYQESLAEDRPPHSEMHQRRAQSNAQQNDSFSYENTYHQEHSLADRPPQAGTNEERTGAGNNEAEQEGRPIEAHIVPNEDDIENQMHDQAKNIADMVQKNLMMNAAVPVDVQPSVQDTTTSSLTPHDHDDATSDDCRKKKRMLLIAVAVFAIIVAIAAGVGVAVSKKSDGGGGGGDPQEQCSFCYDGSTPSNLETNQVDGGQTCAQFLESQILLGSTDPRCSHGQAIAWARCECPTLPPPPENPACTICANGAVPVGNGCEDFNTFVALVGNGNGCDQLAQAFLDGGCTCPDDDVSALQSILKPISGDALNDADSPQSKAFNWIAHEDLVDMSVGETDSEIIKSRYVASVLYFALGGQAWTEQYNFLSEGDICTWNRDGLDGFQYGYGIACDSIGIVASVRLPENNLKGSVPKEIGFFSDLHNIDMANNTITGDLPSSLESLTGLEYLNFTENRMSGPLPEYLFSHQHLTHIQLDNNSFTGTLSPSLGTSPKLLVFWAHGNQLTGPIPSAVGRSSSLGTLDLRRNQLTGTLPEFVPSFTPMWFLDLNDNKLGGTIPRSIGSMSSLQYLSLAENDLWGNIPTELGKLSYLKELWLRANRLNGIMPTELGRCPRLTIIDVGGNDLTGNIGPVIDSLPRSLKGFDFDTNRLEGTIPTSIGSLSLIDWFDAYDNNLSGTIPSEFGSLSMLEMLDLPHNRFTGTVPTSLASLPLLVHLRVIGNDLTGSIGAEFCQNTFETLIANTCAEPTKIECACCTHCCDPGVLYCEEL